MRVHPLVLLVPFLVARPGDLAAQPAPVTVSFDFAHGEQGWSAFFADHPPGVDESWGLTAGLRPLPAELGLPHPGFMISGNNHSDDLAMALKRRLGTADGIEPGQTYWVELEIHVASDAPSGAVGVGGSPGDSVYLKAGASASEPAAVLNPTDGHLRPTVNVGFQSLGGPAATVVGVIANGRDATDPRRYVTLHRVHRHRFPVQAAADGSLWLLVLTDSAFEGPTTLYYQRIQASLTPVSTHGRLVNLSTRADVASGEAVMIAGLVVQGGARGTYLIRGVGPTLADYGVGGVVSDPILTLRDRFGAPLLSNDDWAAGPDPEALRQTATAVGAFPLREGSRDAAFRVELEPGLYSVFMEGKAGASGVGLVEVYEVESTAAAPRLINLSTRARLGEGEKATFAGLVVRGPDPERILVRAVGPTLQDHGIQTPATNPILTLYAGQTPIATNEAWQEVNAGAEAASAAQRSGAFPLRDGSRDAALALTLEPGLYSLQVEEGGPSAHDGIVLVEVYRVP